MTVKLISVEHSPEQVSFVSEGIISTNWMNCQMKCVNLNQLYKMIVVGWHIAISFRKQVGEVENDEMSSLCCCIEFRAFLNDSKWQMWFAKWKKQPSCSSVCKSLEEVAPDHSKRISSQALLCPAPTLRWGGLSAKIGLFSAVACQVCPSLEAHVGPPLLSFRWQGKMSVYWSF